MSWLPKELLEFYATTTTIRALTTTIRATTTTTTIRASTTTIRATTTTTIKAGAAITTAVRQQLLSGQQLSGHQQQLSGHQQQFSGQQLVIALWHGRRRSWHQRGIFPHRVVQSDLESPSSCPRRPQRAIQPMLNDSLGHAMPCDGIRSSNAPRRLHHLDDGPYSLALLCTKYIHAYMHAA